jgi:adenylate cyclase
MVERLEAMNRDMPARAGQPWPGEVRIGIGLNYGLCCVGNMGSAQRLSYSLIGDTVNLASRIEGLTKYYGVAVAVGGALHDCLPGFAMLELDKVRVVGRDAPETVYALLGDETMAADPAFTLLMDRHARFLRAYRACDWDGALEALDKLEAEAQTFGLAQLHALYRQRIVELSADPPDADWQGVFQATEK